MSAVGWISKHENDAQILRKCRNKIYIQGHPDWTDPGNLCKIAKIEDLETGLFKVTANKMRCFVENAIWKGL